MKIIYKFIYELLNYIPNMAKTRRDSSEEGNRVRATGSSH